MLFAAVAPVFVIIFLGFFLRRSGNLTLEADTSLLRICVNLLYPCLIATTIIGNDSLTEGVNLWLPPLTGILLVGLGYLVSYAGARLLRLPPGPETRTFTYVTGLYNYGYTAIPVVDQLFGAKALGILFTHNLGVEIALWAGASLILADRAHRGEGIPWRRIFSTPVLAILLSVALNWLHIGNITPEWLFGAARMIGSAAIPMALLLTGATLADSLSELAFSKAGLSAVAGACVLRMAILPLAFLAVARWFPCTLELRQVLVVQAAMPCAMLPIVLAKHYDADAGMAVQIVLATTALALLTIPYWISFGMKFVGL